MKWCVGKLFQSLIVRAETHVHRVPILVRARRGRRAGSTLVVAAAAAAVVPPAASGDVARAGVRARPVGSAGVGAVGRLAVFLLLLVLLVLPADAFATNS